MHTYGYTAEWDPEAWVWWAVSDDVPGLVVEAATEAELHERVRLVAAGLTGAEAAGVEIRRAE